MHPGLKRSEGSRRVMLLVRRNYGSPVFILMFIGFTLLAVHLGVGLVAIAIYLLTLVFFSVQFGMVLESWFQERGSSEESSR